MFNFFTSVSSGAVAAGIITLLSGLIGFGITGNPAIFDPSTWTTIFQVIVGGISVITFFISAFCVASELEEAKDFSKRLDQKNRRIFRLEERLSFHGHRVPSEFLDDF